MVGHKGSGKTQQDKPKVENKEKEVDEGKGRFVARGGVHNPSNRLSAGEISSETLPNSLTWARLDELNPRFLSPDDPAVMEPKVQRSIGNSGASLVSFPLFFTGILVLLTLMLHWSGRSSAETKLSQCWSLGPRTLKTFLYRSFYTSMDCVAGVRFCVFACVNVERWSLQRRRKALFFFFMTLYHEDESSHFGTIKMHNSVITNKKCKLSDQNTLGVFQKWRQHLLCVNTVIPLVHICIVRPRLSNCCCPLSFFLLVEKWWRYWWLMYIVCVVALDSPSVHFLTHTHSVLSSHRCYTLKASHLITQLFWAL